MSAEMREPSAKYLVRAGYKETDAGLIPTDWNALPLHAIGQFKNGINKSSEAFGHGSPFVNLMDVFGVCRIDSAEAFGLVKTTDAEQKTYDLKRGDVIFIRSSVKPSGVGLTAVIEVDLPSTVYSGFLIRFRDNDTLDIGFKRHCFYAESFRSKLIGASSVSANTNINQDNLKKLIVAVPPTATEQRAIATALSDVDALIAGLERLIAKKRDIKQAAMQQLLTGQTRLPGFSGEWVSARLGNVASLKNGYMFRSETYTLTADYKVITIANVQDGHMISESCNTVSTPPIDIQPHQELLIGDILISMTGNVGRVCRVSEQKCLLNQRVGKLEPRTVTSDFLFALLRQPAFMASMIGAAKGGAQPNLSASDINEHVFFMPKDLREQTAIAGVLADMDADLSAIESRLTKTRAIKQGMMQELLTGRIRLI